MKQRGIGVTQNRVPASVLFLFRQGDKKILGAVNIRYELNDFLLKYSGNIGYGIAPSKRRKGYASIMLSMTLDICRDLKLEKVLISCNKDNIGSARTIQKNGGILENEFTDDKGIVRQRYWIKL